MTNFYAIDVQSNADGTSGFLPYGFEDKGAAEDKYLAIRAAARQSSVQCHTALLIDKEGNVIEKKCYHHAQPTPEPEAPAGE